MPRQNKRQTQLPGQKRVSNFFGKADDKPADPTSGVKRAIVDEPAEPNKKQMTVSCTDTGEGLASVNDRVLLCGWTLTLPSFPLISNNRRMNAFAELLETLGASENVGGGGSPATTTTNNQSGRGSLAPRGRGNTRGRGGARGGVQNHRGGYAQDAQDRRRTFIQGIVGRADGGALSRHQYDLFLGGGIQALEADQWEHQLQLQQRRQRQAASGKGPSPSPSPSPSPRSGADVASSDGTWCRTDSPTGISPYAKHAGKSDAPTAAATPGVAEFFPARVVAPTARV
ncbi:hypothetical protein V8C43DRAFT_306767 [Trichoderma afarasin]